MTGDGTTSNVLFTGELLAQADRYLAEGMHPRVIVDGFEKARERTLAFLEEYKTPLTAEALNRDVLVSVARTGLAHEAACRAGGPLGGDCGRCSAVHSSTVRDEGNWICTWWRSW